MNLDPTNRVVAFLREQGKLEPLVTRIVLFGSRARGNSHEKSDFDIAVEGDQMSEEAWARWALEVRENVPTLCGIDLVRITPFLSSSLKKKIDQEGRTIYERK